MNQGWKQLFDRNIEQGRLTFTTESPGGDQGCADHLFALPTLPGEDGSGWI